MYKLLDWLSIRWELWLAWLESWKPCPKEEMGYTCHHRILSNGQKECGEWQNYWGASDE